MERKNVVGSAKPGIAARTPARDKPDPRPARLMVGASALAAVTIIGAGLVDFPLAVAEEPLAAPAVANTETVSAKKVEKVKRQVKYVRLKPGQKAPKGAKVIKEAAPTPRVIVQHIVTSAPRRAARPVARTRQSGG